MAEPCEICDGDGRVLDHNKWYVDSGKWKRSFDEVISVECPDCHGTGVEEGFEPVGGE
tara:strand:+ start:289 stop:462 length:174 start_codon:yes stop_codon:yes gene_type:complete